MEARKNDEYFASLEGEELRNAILQKRDDYYLFLNQSGFFTLWSEAFNMYYKTLSNGPKIKAFGKNSEYRSLSCNYYKSILTSIKTMILQQKPVFDPIAINTDAVSASETKIASSVLEYYSKEKGLEEYLDQAVESATYLGEGYVIGEWDVFEGELIGKSNEGMPVYSGDPRFSAHLPTSVCRDFFIEDPKQNKWYVVTSLENKFDIAARYASMDENKAREIKGLSLDFNQFTPFLFPWKSSALWQNSDLIEVITLYHMPTPSVPNGRLVKFVSKDIGLIDTAMPYKYMPVHRITAGNLQKSNFGWTLGFDLIQMQEAYSLLDSTILTNQLAFGVQNVLNPEGNNLSVDAISGGGLKFINYRHQVGKPEALQLCATPAEVFNYRNMIRDDMNLVSQINQTAMGNPPPNLESGSALAFMQSIAIQFVSGLQRSYVNVLEDIGTSLISILQQFANTNRLIQISGIASEKLFMEFSNQNIKGIQRVLVDVGNPLSQTKGGRIQLAQDFLKMGVANTPERYLQVLTTGRLDNMLENQELELIQIKKENESLQKGTSAVMSAVTDNHVLHILEHRSIISAPEARTDPALLQRTLLHVDEHINQLMNMNPILAQILKQPVLGQNMAPVAGESQNMSNPNGVNQAAVTNAAPVEQKVNSIQEPQMPKMPDVAQS